MTEAEWLAGEDPREMLKVLRDGAYDRKFRLLAVSALWPHTAVVRDTADRAVVAEACETAEATSTRRDLLALWQRIGPWVVSGWDWTPELVVRAAGLVLDSNPLRAAERMISAVTHLETAHAVPSEENRRTCTRRLAAHVRDIFGNPFRSVGVERRWLTSTVLDLARGIYDERAFDRLPILADAVQDAGCDHPDILAHCRGDGPHVRGCWVVDLVLGKN
ncbi:MAG: hypothetical protein JWO38_8277 [Gemmataceae bacterium]|nr:hypothetical protein [Gemmataceae bacterium]